MKVICYKCQKKIKEKGALIISPPNVITSDMDVDVVAKFHICKHCWGGLYDWMKGDYDP